MENTEIYGRMSLKSGKYANDVVNILINAGFLVARTGCTITETQFEILKKKEIQ